MLQGLVFVHYIYQSDNTFHWLLIFLIPIKPAVTGREAGLHPGQVQSITDMFSFLPDLHQISVIITSDSQHQRSDFHSNLCSLITVCVIVVIRVKVQLHPVSRIWTAAEKDCKAWSWYEARGGSCSVCWPIRAGWALRCGSLERPETKLAFSERWWKQVLQEWPVWEKQYVLWILKHVNLM